MKHLGRSNAEMAEVHFAESIHPDDQKEYREQWRRLTEGKEDTFHFEYRIQSKRDGEWCWVQSHGVVLKRERGAVVTFGGLDQDLTERKKAEAIIQQQFVDLERVFHQAESLRVASLLTHTSIDLDENIELVLTLAKNLIPFDRATVSQLVCGELRERWSAGEAAAAHDVAPSNQAVWAVLETRTPSLHCDEDQASGFGSWLGIPLIVRDRVIGVLEFWHRDCESFTGEHIWPAMGFADSIAESLSNSHEYEGLREEAQTDPLTGLYSRRHLDSVGPKLLQACQQDRQPVALLLVDVDHFKLINDNHGHLVGDAILMSIAQLCRSLLRQGDLFFRYGGEEFIAILPNTDAEVAVRVAGRLREITAGARFRGIKNEVTASIGVASVAPGHLVEFAEVLAEADQAMYQAKAKGRNTVVLSSRWSQTPVHS